MCSLCLISLTDGFALHRIIVLRILKEPYFACTVHRTLAFGIRVLEPNRANGIEHFSSRTTSVDLSACRRINCYGTRNEFMVWLIRFNELFMLKAQLFLI